MAQAQRPPRGPKWASRKMRNLILTIQFIRDYPDGKMFESILQMKDLIERIIMRKDQAFPRFSTKSTIIYSTKSPWAQNSSNKNTSKREKDTVILFFFSVTAPPILAWVGCLCASTVILMVRVQADIKIVHNVTNRHF